LEAADGTIADGTINGVIVHPNGRGGELRFSDHVVDVIARTWTFTLTWIGGHPFLSVFAMLLWVWFVVTGRRAKAGEIRMKQDYDIRRRDTRDRRL